MFKTLILKEIQEAIHNFRFLIVTLLCLVLIPLCVYVTLKDYEQRLADYNDAVRLYQERSEGKRIWGDFQAEGYRPPSVLSVFSIGLEYVLSNKIITSQNGQFKIIDESGIVNPQSLLFGKADFVFIVGFILSLLALIFTYNSISGEKEKATLCLIISNSIPRWKILLAKFLGNYIVFIFPFIIAVIIALLILNISGTVSIFSPDIFTTFIVIFLITLLFISCIFNLGLLVSTLTHQSTSSMIILLFVWVVLVLAIPKVTPMIAQILYPIKSTQVVTIEKQMTRKNLEEELDHKLREMYDRTLIDHGIDPKEINAWEVEDDVLDMYYENRIPVEKEYRNRIGAIISKIERNFINKQNTQARITTNLSRISPMSCYTYFMSNLCGTGVFEINNLHENAQRFQNKVNREIYDNFFKRTVGGTSGSSFSQNNPVEGFDPKNISVPHLTKYSYASLEQVLKAEWIDIVLLVLFNILFFAASFVSFLKYDVR